MKLFCIKSVLALLLRISLNYKQNVNKIEEDLKHKNSILKILTIVIISLSFGILLPTSTGFSQSYLRIYDEIGGGGNTTTQQSDNSSNTTLYIVAGVVVAGVVAYVLITKNKKKDKEEESDTTSALIRFDDSDVAAQFNDFEHELEKVKDQIPVNVFLGVRNERAFVSDRTYLMGVSVRF
jgi:hypothetical protein